MRPRRHRKIYNKPASRMFHSADGLGENTTPITLSLDEYEAVRLADLENLYQSEAAEYMDVSRQTFGRILKEAHRKIAEHLVYGNSLIIKGGSVEFEALDIECDSCGHTWHSQPERAEDLECPECHSNNILHKLLHHHRRHHHCNGNHHGFHRKNHK